MVFKVALSSKSEKDFNKLSKKNKARVLLALDSLGDDPYSGKKLKGELKGTYSVRVWPFRIIYIIHNKKCLVLVI